MVSMPSSSNSNNGRVLAFYNTITPYFGSHVMGFVWVLGNMTSSSFGCRKVPLQQSPAAHFRVVFYLLSFSALLTCLYTSSLASGSLG